jgi:hypothetical protein
MEYYEKDLTEGGDGDIIEETKGADRDVPMDIQKALEGANPNYEAGKWGGPYNDNCQRCVPAYELRRRGEDVEALPCNNPHRDIYTWDWTRPYKDIELDRVNSSRTKTYADNINKKMTEWGDGSRAAVHVEWKGGMGAHVFIAEQHKGKTLFLDPQNGRNDVSDYFKRAREVVIGRIDNVTFFDKMGDIVKDRGK